MKKVLVANWKMNGSFEVFSEYLTNLQRNYNFPDVDLIIAPPFPYINFVKKQIKHSSIFVAGQNITHLPDGARTGEINARILKDIGAEYVIIGHSECRSNSTFKDAFATQTILSAIENGLKVVFCFGEELDNKSGNEIIIEQIAAGLENIDKKHSKSIIIAYEPVWAIGTGIVPTSEQILEKRHLIHATLQNFEFLETPIIYGGSVNPQNAVEFINNAKIDGLIVGKASMDFNNVLKMLSIL